MSSTLQERLAESLARLKNPRTGNDLFSTQQVRDIATTTSGRVRLTLLLAEGDDPTLAKEVRETVSRVQGVTDVELDVKPVAGAGRPGGGRMLPVMDQTPAAPPRPAAPTPKRFPNLGRVIAVSSGKGGVGKSTVAVNLAVALAKSGARVGLMDADIYGPNIPRMMGVSGAPSVVREKIVPLEAHGVKLISLGVGVRKATSRFGGRRGKSGKGGKQGTA